MTMKEKILHYFRDINYAYNDCTKYDTLKAGLEEMEKEHKKNLSCNSCKHYGKLSLDCARCDDSCSQYMPKEGLNDGC